MLSRGQTWAEYIVILSVVIIIAGVAMYIAGFFPSTSKHIEERESVAYWLSADVGIVRYQLNSSLCQLVIKNNRNFKIRVDSITSRGAGSLTAPGGLSSVTLEPGQTAQVNVTGLNCSSETYSLPIEIKYSDVRYGATYSLIGEKPLVGRCMGSFMPPPPECSSDSECGTNTTPCDPYCSINILYSYPSNPAECQRTCNDGRCWDCTPSCGAPSQTNCGKYACCLSATCASCQAGYGNCNEDPADLCEANLQTDIANCGTCGNHAGWDSFVARVYAQLQHAAQTPSAMMEMHAQQIHAPTQAHATPNAPTPQSHPAAAMEHARQVRTTQTARRIVASQTAPQTMANAMRNAPPTAQAGNHSATIKIKEQRYVLTPRTM